MSEKIYCGNAKEIETKYGKMLKISFSKKDLQELNKAMEGKEWVNCNLKEKQNKQEGKSTHYLELDNYVKPTPPETKIIQEGANPNEKTDDLPF